MSIPTAIVTAIAVLAVAPAFGRALFSPGTAEFWPSLDPWFRPEPVEQGRYLLALVAPLVLTALTAWSARRSMRMSAQTLERIVLVTQLLWVAAVVACLIAQRNVVYGAIYTDSQREPFHRRYFTDMTLLVAAAGTVGVVAFVRSAAARRRWSVLTARRGMPVIAAVVAAAITILWLSHAFNTETTIPLANRIVASHLEFPLDETFSVLDGRTPLVDFTPLYGFLWPYAFAAGMWLIGDSIGVYLLLCLLATGAAMLAVYAALRRVAGSAWNALLLYLPFLATSFFLVHGSLDDRFTFATLPGTFPMRYAGPFVLLWLVVRHLDDRRPRQPWLLFVVAGIVAMNNPDAGIPALGATVAALLWTLGRPSLARVARLAGAAVAGLAIAYALVSALTLVRAGALPDLGALMYFPRAFAAVGFYLLPMPTFGLHLVVYGTFVAAIGTATARAVRGDANRPLTGMLAFAGVLGLGVGAYFAGRSHPDNLIAMFPTWSLTLGLLAIVSVRRIAARAGHRALPAEFACLFGVAVAACSLAQTPAPWTELQRLDRTAHPVYAEPNGQAFVAENVERGESVAILLHLGHRMAFNLGIDNVSPYANYFAMPLAEQLQHAIDALRAAGGRKVFVRAPERIEIPDRLAAAGFVVRAQDRDGTQMWVAPF